MGTRHTVAHTSIEGEDGTQLHVYRLTQADPWKTELRKVRKRSHRQGYQYGSRSLVPATFSSKSLRLF